MKLGFTINGRFTSLPLWMGIAVRYGLQAPVSRVIRGTTLGAQVAALDDENRILLIRQSYTPDWQFPGGGVDAGETVEEAAIREMQEEAGARPESPLELLGVYANFRSMPGDHVFLYTCQKVVVDEFPSPNREIVDHGFFALDALPENTAPAVHRRLAEMDGQVERSLHW